MKIQWIGVQGRLTAGISDTDTEITSDGLAELPEIVAPDYAKITLDPLSTAGRPEVVYVTAHTDGATTATITRGEETVDGGSVARAHNAGVRWQHAATPEDYEGMAAKVAKSTLGAKGSLISASAASTPAEVAVGTNGYVLVAQSGQSTGLACQAQSGLVVNTVAAAGTTETLDGDDYNIHDITLDETCEFTFTTSATVAQFTLILRQDGSGGNSVTWPGSVKWHSATAPTILTTASAVHVLEFLTVDAGTTWRGFLASSNVS